MRTNTKHFTHSLVDDLCTKDTQLRITVQNNSTSPPHKEVVGHICDTHQWTSEKGLY